MLGSDMLYKSKPEDQSSSFFRNSHRLDQANAGVFCTHGLSYQVTHLQDCDDTHLFTFYIQCGNRVDSEGLNRCNIYSYHSFCTVQLRGHQGTHAHHGIGRLLAWYECVKSLGA